MEYLTAAQQQWAAFTARFPLETKDPVWTPENAPAVSVLFVFNRAANGTTSMEVDSLAAQALLLFAGYPHIVKDCHEHDQSPSGQLPYLLTTKGKALAGREIIDEVMDQIPGFGSYLKSTEKADSFAISSLAESKLHLGLLYDLWYSPQNSLKVAFPQYSHDRPWPLKEVLPRIRRWEQMDWMLKHHVTIDKEEILDDVKVALSAYAVQLDQKQYLFGSKPTLADATLFAYLHILLSTFNTAAGSHSHARDIIMRHDNLVQYARRIWGSWFTERIE
ncbi:hypothetical protein BJ741DRAFT_612509 [Chytriomyces cf. hyalinus JEL632]|nr:hypothetical protein BJ741DRAFT_612509 [Chytriomyces cf. hyalinus JEL632]